MEAPLADFIHAICFEQTPKKEEEEKKRAGFAGNVLLPYYTGRASFHRVAVLDDGTEREREMDGRRERRGRTRTKVALSAANEGLGVRTLPREMKCYLKGWQCQ